MARRDVMTEYTRSHLLGYAQLLEDIGKDYLGTEPFCENDYGKDYYEAEHYEAEHCMSREKLLSTRQINQSRILFGKFIMDAAGQLEQIAQISESDKEQNRRLIRRIEKQLSRANIQLHNFQRKKNRNGYDEVGMIVSAKGKDFYNVSDIADLLSRALHKNMLPLADGYQYVHNDRIPLIFEEDCFFQIESGYALATKDNETVSGDNYLLRDFGDGTFIAAIADGMGCGRQACRDSEKALSLLERYMEAGLDISQMIQSCNRLFYLRRDLEESVTLDILECNQYTGEANLYKYGAAGSYLIRGRKIRSIGPYGVALGIHADAYGSLEKLYLKADDIVIMLSDGVMDYYADKIDVFERTLVNARANTLAELATAILQRVIVANEGKIMDDMTVLVLQIYEREP